MKLDYYYYYLPLLHVATTSGLKDACVYTD